MREHTAGQDDCIEKMRNLKAGFIQIGYENPEHIAEFIEMVS